MGQLLQVDVHLLQTLSEKWSKNENLITNSSKCNKLVGL